MGNKIPVFIHHETGEKPQHGGEKKQKYLKYCVEQAQNSGNRVILFGDQYNRDWCKEWHSENEYLSEKWDKFESVFLNMSTYPDEWAKGIFKRFFIIEEYISENNIEQFILLDSDVLLYIDFNIYNGFDGFDVAFCMEENQKLDVPIENNQMRMAANVGVSYWTKESLQKFTDFCIATYEKNSDILLQKWNLHKKYHIPGGVCEMSLVYLWSKNEEIKVKNIAIEENGVTFNNNIIGTSNYYNNEFIIDKLFNIKKIKYIECRPYFITKDHRLIGTYCLHFGGESKRYIKDFYEREKISVKTKFIDIYWLVRKGLSRKVKIIIKSILV